VVKEAEKRETRLRRKWSASQRVELRGIQSSAEDVVMCECEMELCRNELIGESELREVPLREESETASRNRVIRENCEEDGSEAMPRNETAAK